MSSIITLLYLASGIFFILSLRGLSHPTTAYRGGLYAICGMITVIISTLLLNYSFNYLLIIVAIVIGATIGISITKKVQMRSLPQLIAAFHSLVGASAVITSLAIFYNPSMVHIGAKTLSSISLVEMGISILIGGITFSGSLYAALKLQGLLKGNNITFPRQMNLTLLVALLTVACIISFIISPGINLLIIITILSITLGLLIIFPIGGGDMPVAISLMNSSSGMATVAVGFTLSNLALIIVGSLVASSGAILSYIMSVGINRSILNILSGKIISTDTANHNSKVDKQYKQGNGDDAAFMLQNASNVIIVPGYGMAVAQAQYAVKELADLLKEKNVNVRYAIHPVAGRMPGHMNVLLTEANVDYEDIYELEEINNEFQVTDIVFVIGANDVTNPSAREDTSSPIYGMPILNVDKSNLVMFIKRSMNTGYSGIDNPLFYNEKTMMLLGDAKEITESILQSLKS